MLAAVREHLDGYRRAHPIPDLEEPTAEEPAPASASAM